MSRKEKLLVVGGAVIFLMGSFLFFSRASAATLSVSPAAGTFTAGSTFDVSVYLNTESQSVNAVRTFLSFPPDKLQLVSKGTGPSIIAVYTSPPRFDNQAGIIDLQGGIPGGINVSSGVITTFTFRVKTVGTAILRFRDESTVLLNDGQGTEALRRKQDGIYELVLPPPAGPIVSSPTHPEQGKWYSNITATLVWAPEDPAVTAYSYVINTNPTDTPDDISEGAKTSVTYRNLSDGMHFFHIKALRAGAWGGVTHFAVDIDSSPPAEFPIEIIPGARTARRQPVIQFATTDALSGLDHYELKLIPLTVKTNEQPLFIEATSPYITSLLEFGSYDVVVRAYDKAGNYREALRKLKIVSNVFRFIGERGLEIRSTWVVPWLWFWIILALLLLIFGYLAFRLARWHRRLDLSRAQKALPEHISSQLDELKRYRERYGKIYLLFLACGLSLFLGNQAFAQQVEFAPPLVTTVSRNITNEEIFYVGGKTDAADTEVIIYLQNLTSGETISERVISDKQGDWFYRHNAFLSNGNYLLWAQSKIGEELSPPSPQIQLTVRRTALQFGASRISFEAMYLGIIVMLAIILSLLMAYTVYHAVHGRRKNQLLLKEIRQAEESVRRGFAVLRRDIQAELSIIHQAKLSKALSAEEEQREQQLLKDLDEIEKYIGKEIWEVEKAESV